MPQSSGPKSSGERVLHSVLARANLLQYFDVFISQGGDDVNQLCEAGEEEFLEIMALVGMASKPLHVRRLQKALHEWLTNPEIFENSALKIDSSKPGLNLNQQYKKPIHPGVMPDPTQHRRYQLSTGGLVYQETPEDEVMLLPILDKNGTVRVESSLSPASHGFGQDNSMQAGAGYENKSDPSGSNVWSCRLTDQQRRAIEDTADMISQHLPYYAAKPLNMKKPVEKEIEEVMNLPRAQHDSNRMDQLRKYSAIYGRFDSKRKLEKQMNFHEMCVNEAAAQLCKHRPSLLSRREDLFVLSRQVVRDAGFQYTKPQYKSVESSLESQIKLMKPDSCWPSDVSVRSETEMNTSKESTHSDNDCNEDSNMRGDERVSMHKEDTEAKRKEDGEVPSSLVDVGLCFARQYGLADLEGELLRDFDQKPSPATLANSLYNHQHSDMRNTERSISANDC